LVLHYYFYLIPTLHTDLLYNCNFNYFIVLILTTHKMGDSGVLNSALGVGKFWPELPSQFLVNVNSTRNEQVINS